MPIPDINAPGIDIAKAHANSRAITDDVDLTTIVIPTPDSYSPANPERQRENLAYVELQIYEIIKAQSAIEQAALALLWADQDALIDGQSAALTDLRPNLSGAWQQTFDAMLLENANLKSLPETLSHYALRASIVSLHDSLLRTVLTDERLADLQYNSEEMHLSGSDAIISLRGKFSA